ncbi:MAG: HAD family phosphatase [Candidatus Aenigmarchaeota archaeon]|nr:HAD family phosphatase [Candidatus Aenigmarchaeota archaeon]
MKDRLVIFDLYRTLIEAENIADNAYIETVKALYDVDGGRTDADPTSTTIQSVVSQIAGKKGISKEDIEISNNRILPTYENIFERCLNEGKVVTLSGVSDLIEYLRENKVPFGVYTGDSFRTLDALLKKVGLNNYFPEDMRSCGSNETSDRTELLRIAIEKSERKYRLKFSRDGIYVVDDSWRGIKAGEILGINSIGVGGNPERFERYGVKPTYFFEDLRDYNAIMKIVLS